MRPLVLALAVLGALLLLGRRTPHDVPAPVLPVEEEEGYVPMAAWEHPRLGVWDLYRGAVTTERN